MSKGRPALFRGASAKVVANILRKHGLKGGQSYIAEVGVRIPGMGKGRTALEVSLPTLQKIAAEHGVEFKRGRPAASGSAVAAPAKPKKAKKAKRGRPLGSKNKAKVVKRGRPLGSKNKPKLAPVVSGKKRGRPLGSKNKPKLAPVAAPVVETPVVDTPVVQPVVAEVTQPVVDTPVVETPVVDTPVGDQQPETPVVAEASTDVPTEIVTVPAPSNEVSAPAA